MWKSHHQGEILLYNPVMPFSDDFIEPPIRPIKRRSSFINFIQSPAKRAKTASKFDDFITPARRGAKAPSPDFIAPRQSVLTIKRHPRKSVQCRNASKARQLPATTPPLAALGEVDFVDWGGVEDSSPYKAKDNIDWTVSAEDVEKLKLELLPCYWEKLTINVNSIVRVTERLYIIQDWYRHGYLRVQIQ